MSFFTVTTDRGDVEDLMAKVSNRLADLEQTGQLGNLHTALLPAVSQSVSVDDQLRALHAQWSINPNEIIHSNRPRFGPAIVRFQRLVRRATFWYLNPILDQIVAFNAGVVRALSGLRAEQESLRDDLARFAVVASASTSTNSSPSSATEASGSESQLAAELRDLKMRVAQLETRLAEQGREWSRD